ncbi:MAG: pirin-like C-terminal cupin domain-containing protein [Bacteroidales bacterium]
MRLVILEGGIETEGQLFEPGQLLVATQSTLGEFTLQPNSRVYIFGGEPFSEQRFIDWNFVSSDKNLIDKAKQKWKDQAFEKVKGDEAEFIPYPLNFEKNTLQGGSN